MKNTQTKLSKKSVKETRPEYHFDDSKSRSNRFAVKSSKSPLVVVLDPDVAKVFTTPESVNNPLRVIITAMPEKAKHKATA
jgi:hypothetical protein